MRKATTLKRRSKKSLRHKTKKGGFFGKPKLTDEVKYEIQKTIKNVIETLMKIWLGLNPDGAKVLVDRITGENVNVDSINTMYDTLIDNSLKATRENVKDYYRSSVKLVNNNITYRYFTFLKDKMINEDSLKWIVDAMNDDYAYGLSQIFSDATFEPAVTIST